MQKYPHIIESFACILQVFVLMFLLYLNFFISFGICSTPTLSKYITPTPMTFKAAQLVYFDLYSSRSITYAPTFTKGKLFLESTSINLDLV